MQNLSRSSREIHVELMVKQLHKSLNTDLRFCPNEDAMVSCAYFVAMVSLAAQQEFVVYHTRDVLLNRHGKQICLKEAISWLCFMNKNY